MKMKLSSLLGLALVACTVVAPLQVVAQTGQNQNISSLELDQADVRDALKILFRSTGLSYTVASDVQGTITVSMTDVPLRTALRNILNQVDSTWREEGGVFNIVRKQPPVTGTTENPLGGLTNAVQEKPRKIYIRKADPWLIATILSGTGSTTINPEYSSSVGVQSIGGGGGGFGGGGFGGGGFGGFGGGGQGGFGGGGFGGGGFGGGGFGGGGFGGGGFGGGGGGNFGF